MGGCFSAPASRKHREKAELHSDDSEPKSQQVAVAAGAKQATDVGAAPPSSMLLPLHSASSLQRALDVCAAGSDKQRQADSGARPCDDMQRQADNGAQPNGSGSAPGSLVHSTPSPPSTRSSSLSRRSSTRATLPAMEMDHRVMVEDTLEQALNLPYSVFASGPYSPPCNDDRVAYSNNLGLMDSAPDPQIAHLLTSLGKVFDTSSVLLTLCGQQRVWIRNAIGFSAGDFPWRWAFCGWSLSPPTPQVLVIDDTLQDARFRDNLVVTGKPHIRSFAGAPLVASNGHRLGTLCFLGPQPRTISAQEATILSNMAELVVRELEKDAVKKATEQEAARGNESKLDKYMLRSVACFTDEAIAFVDTYCPLWQAQHCNIALSDETSIPYDTVVEKPFWELFAAPFEPGSEPWDAALEVVSQAGEFVVRGCTVRNSPELGSFTLTFRPADRTALDGDTQLIGVPSDVMSDFEAAGRYYFCLVERAEHETLRTNSATSSERNADLAASLRMQQAAPQTPIPGLELGPLLGKGSFGKVYRGRYKGRLVAVKVCLGALQQGRGKVSKPWSGVEATTARRLNHPGIVRTFKHTAVLVQEGQQVSKAYTLGNMGSLGSSTSWSDNGWFDDEEDPMCQAAPHVVVEMETWAILEYCNRGTLQAGVDKGLFRQERTCRPPSPPNVAAVIATAAQLAEALRYLHDHDIIHGDLCGGNILLTSDGGQPHGFTCKVADFGLSRELNFQSRMQTISYGTVTHMPPELLTEGRLSKAADVYALGVLLWEMVTGTRAWAAMSHTQILAAVGMDGRRLRFPSGSHLGLAELGARCMSRNEQERPTIPEVALALDQLQAQLHEQPA